MRLNRTRGVAVVVALLLVGCYAASRLRAPDRELASVRAETESMFQADRYFVPRLSPGGSYLPCADANPAISSECRPTPSPGSPLFTKVVRLVRKSSATPSRETAEARHLAGLALLLTGDAESASKEFLVALRMEPTNQRIASDVLAAQLIRFERVEASEALLEAFRSIGDSHPGESSYAPFLFNWALLLERTGLTVEATETWARFLTAEPDPRWRKEAMSRRGKLQDMDGGADWDALREAMTKGQVTREVPPALMQHARLLIEDELLGEWAEMELGGDRHAEGRLRFLHQAVQQLALAQRDRLLLDAVERLADPSSRAELAEAHRSYSLARRAHESQDYEVAGAHFRQSAEGFRAARSPFEIWPRFYLAVILHHRPDFRAAESDLIEIRQDSRLPRYPIAGAYVDWMLGLGSSRMADYDRSERHFRAALERFVRAGEIENAAAMESQLGKLIDKIGSPQQAWHHHHAASATLPLIIKSRRKQNLLIAAGEFLHRQGATSVASLYFDSAVREAEESGLALSVALTLQQRSQFLSAIGRPGAARRDVERALTAARAIPDPGLRSDTELFLMLARADQLQRDEPAMAVALLTDAIHRAREHQAERGLVSALAARAQARQRLGERDLAVEDLERALLEIERQRWRLEDPGERRAFLVEARDILEELVRVEWESARFVSALHWVERFRARVLGESLGLSTADSLATYVPSPEDLPPGTLVQAFLVAEREVFIWWLSPGKMRVDRRDLGEVGEIDSLVSTWRRSLQAGGEQLAAGNRLSELLLPFDWLGEKPARWVFVPDSSLHRLPFAALPLVDGSRLIEHASVIVAPSVGAFLHLDSRGARPSFEGADILVVSGVEHDTATFPELARLPRSWPVRGLPATANARHLGGAAATPAAFLEQARAATVLHFAGHAVAESTQRPAGLVLAPEADDDGLLSIEDLRGLAPTRLRLAILSGCGTGTGRPTALDGPDSIVQPFLAAGVASVVGTLWEVNDVTATRFFEALMEAHQQPDPVRRAQLRLLRSQPRSTAWSGFQHYGAGLPTEVSVVAKVEK